MRKFLSILLSLLIAFSAVTPGLVVAGAYTEHASDAYAVIFSASDFQSDTCYTNFSNMMQAAQADGITETPDGFLFGGDYTAGSEDPSVQVPKIIDTVQGVYAEYSEDNMIFVQGNHDAANDVLTPTGLYEFEHYWVYSINEDDFKKEQSGRSPLYDTTVQALAEEVTASLEGIKLSGDLRPVFVITHVPLHHSSRDSYGDNIYSKYLFDVLNEYGQYLDIIFLFGHNHSSTYDDYIGGAVNYIAKGETMRVPIPDESQQGENGYTDETLNFTYMNCGYVGYSSNSTIAPSTNTLTMGAFELCTSTIQISRYSTDGLYATETIERINPMTTDPYVRITGAETGNQGDSAILYGASANIEGATYSWSTSDESVVKVLPAGKNAQVIYNGGGTADVTLTVTDKDGNTYSEKITIEVESATTITYEEVSGEEYDVYVLTNNIASGRYVIASGNTAGEVAYAMNGSLSNNILGANEVTVFDGSDDSEINGPYIKVTNDSIVWTAGGSSDAYTFVNGNTNLATDKNGNNLNNNTNYNKWRYQGNILSQTAAKSGYLNFADGEYFANKNSSSYVYFYKYVKDVIIESGIKEIITTAPYEPEVMFKKGSKDIDGQRLEFYSVTYGEGFMIDGSFTGFSDQSDKVVTSWTSSNPSAVTVENGYVTLVGKGEATITYTVTDGTTTIEKSVTVFASKNEKPKTYYLLTNTLVDGELYVIASTNTLGTTAVLVPPVIETGKTDHNIRFSETSANIQHIIGLPGVGTANKNAAWKAISTGTDGYFYLQNVENGYYMYASNDAGTNDLGSTESRSTNGTVWHINDAGFLVSNDSIAIKHSGDNNFRACPESEAEGNFIYQKTELTRWVNIRSKYQNVQNNVLTRQNVCPFQSETLLARTELFTVSEEDIEFVWTSSNPDVATIDSNGVVTYTGKPGTVEFSVVATATVPNEDGEIETAAAKTTITVLEQTIKTDETFVITDNFVNGEYYVISGANTAGSSYILGNTEDHTISSSEYRMKGISITITIEAAKATIHNSDLNGVWQAEDAGNGYFRLRNAATGKYLALICDNGYDPYRQIITVEEADMANYPAAAFLIGRNSDNKVYSKQSYAYLSSDNAPNILRLAESGDFRMSASNNNAYIYQRTSSRSIAPLTEIRVSTLLGTDNITNELQNRYNVKEGDTERLLRYTENFATIESTTWTVSDTSVATIDENGLLTYTGKNGFVSITLVVTGTDAEGNSVKNTVMTTINVSTEDYEAPTEDYPQYPHEGAVRINKTASNEAGGRDFQDTGVTEVELSVTGVPLPQAVDVVVVLDHSSSMTNDGSGLRLTNAIANTRDFALQLVNANKNNRIAIVTFDRYRDGYDDIADTTDNYTTDSSSKEDRIITGDGTAEGAFMTFDESEELIAQIDSLATNNTAGTNYDYGLREAYNILNAAKNDDKANKMQYVIFMSDGEPYLFNRLHIEYGTNDPDGLYEAWLRGNEESNAALQNALKDPTSYPVTQFYNPDGENWFAQAIKAPAGTDIAGLPDDPYYANVESGIGATMFTIGFEAGTPGTLTGDILTNMATLPENYYYTEGDIQAAYDSILEKILYAANNAVVTDKMGENFDLQFAASYSLGNDMSDITLEPAPFIEIGSWTLNSDGTRNQYTVHETITFVTNANGDLTEAYSTECDGNIYDVAASTINGKYVSYNLLDEVFTWNIGDITRDEITLRYYAYLSGSAEGEREAGVYDTNEYARLDYINYRGSDCQQTFPVPSLGWKQAAVNYEFYIVNEKGEPVNRNGIVVPFAERVLIGQEQTKDILLNSAGEYTAYTLVAKDELPDGYVLFNQNASYQIAVSSGTNPSKAVICDELAIKTTYFRDGTITICCDGEVPGVHDYTNTHVSFAVLYTKGIVPDTVVIDYGLPVKISVLANDYAVSGGRITRIGTSFTEEIDYKNNSFDKSMLADGVEAELTLPDGIAAIDGDKIVFTSTTLTMDTENVFYYEYQDTDGKFYYAQVTVIPAANIYYEESFFTFTDGNGYVWKTAGETLEDKYQAEDRPGNFSFADADANFVYGYDSAYADSCTYSLGSAKYTSVDSKSFGKEPLAEFTFCGTGFDLFSVTNVDTGAVLVTVYKDSAVYKNFIVNTYYGYTYDSETDKYVPNPDSKESLWQVPVISARDLGYNTYRVVVKPLYSSMFDMAYDKNAENNSYDIYIDSVRIYDPAGADVKENTVIGDAYIADGEFSPSYCEIRRNILDAKSFNAGVETLPEDAHINGAIFIDGSASLDDAVSDLYLEHGPNNELYLAKGQAVAFHISSDRKLTLSSLQLGMKVVSGDNADVVIMNTNELVPRTITVSGATESYRRLNSAIVWDQTELDENGTYKTKYPIVILNNSKEDTVVSLTQFKWAYTSAPESGDEAVTLSLKADTPMMAFAAVRRVQEASVTEDETESFPYTDEEISISWADTELTEGETAVLKVVTPVDVVRVTVDGIDITECEIDEQGNKLWTYSFVVNTTGESTFDILLFDNDGNVSSTISSDTITVEESEEITDDESGEGTDDEPMSILEIIMNWIRKIITFFRRVFG